MSQEIITAFFDFDETLLDIELIGHPHVVEPTDPLKEVALAKKWPILTYT